MTTTTIVIKADAIFAAGRDYKEAEGRMIAALRTTQPKAQKHAILMLQAGMIAAALFSQMNNDDAAKAVEAMMNKGHKNFDKAEKAAASTARSKISRLLKNNGIPNLDKRGGSANAKKRGTKNKAAPAKKTETKKAAPKTVLATYVSPTIAKADDWATHVAFVTKNLGLTFTKAKPYLDKKAQAQYLKALSNFKVAVSKIKA